MRKRISLLLGVFACLFLTAFSRPTQLARPAVIVQPSFTLVDARLPEQFKTQMESLIISNCGYGINRIGDKDFTPGLATVLTDHLSGRFNDALKGKQIKLVNFTVHQNMAYSGRRGITQTMGGLVDTLANDHSITGCAAEDLRGGYQISEEPSGKIVWVVVIDIEVDSRLLHVRSIKPMVHSDPRMLDVKGSTRAETKVLQQRAWNEEVGSAIEKNFTLLDNTLSELLGFPVPTVRTDQPQSQTTGSP